MIRWKLWKTAPQLNLFRPLVTCGRFPFTRSRKIQQQKLVSGVDFIGKTYGAQISNWDSDNPVTRISRSGEQKEVDAGRPLLAGLRPSCKL